MEWNSEPAGLDLVRQTFELDQQQLPDEAALIEMLAERIAQMLDTETDLLFSTLYRLDVAEVKINQVLHSPFENPAQGLARLVIERQKEKVKTRQQYGSQQDK